MTLDDVFTVSKVARDERQHLSTFYSESTQIRLIYRCYRVPTADSGALMERAKETAFSHTRLGFDAEHEHGTKTHEW
ncbi:hypothetical protein AC579_3816 [Pseudocercospora musae]|uniref:Uncharacterized protein n=1 Tax=Pseudocercospora musae TaxID=113226 RepID=A0A139HD36_9PEZI|nr:hypothetical protein AC579_3816 [Pseudocercospora musae]